MYETGLPHTLDPHTLETLGPDTFNGALTLKAFAAHFRIDARQDVSEPRPITTPNSRTAIQMIQYSK